MKFCFSNLEQYFEPFLWWSYFLWIEIVSTIE